MAGDPCTTTDCDGHVLDDGFCDTCGRPPAAAPAAPPAEAGLTTAGEPGETCPDCGTTRDAGSSFCEACGHPFVDGTRRPAAPRPTSTPVPAASTEPAPAPTPAPTGRWEAVVAADAGWFSLFCEAWAKTEQGPCPVTFPGVTERRVALVGPVVVVGRHADGIDVADDPDDPAASHRHASLTEQPDGTWLLTDLGSSNGTYVDDDTRLGDGESRPLAAGGSFHVGAFTRITVDRVTG